MMFARSLPFALLLLDIWPLGRLGTGPRGWGRAGTLLAEKSGLFLMSALSCSVTLAAQTQAIAPLEGLPPWARAANAVLSCGRYLAKTAWPAGLGVSYPHPGTQVPWGPVAASTLVLAAVTAWTLREASRARNHAAVGWLWFLGTLVPTLGLVQVGGAAMADRYTYLPHLGLAWAAAWLFPSAGWARSSLLGWTVAAVFGALAWRQSGFWRDTLSLFDRAVQVSPASPAARNALGAELARRGRLDLARAQFEEAHRLRPLYHEPLSNLGYMALQEGRTAEAVRLLEDAARLEPRDPEVHNNLGMALAASGESQGALRAYRRALELKPDHFGARNNLANLLQRTGRSEEALRLYREALELDPASADAHNNLGAALGGLGRTDEARTHLLDALRLDPSFQAARTNLKAFGLEE